MESQIHQQPPPQHLTSPESQVKLTSCIIQTLTQTLPLVLQNDSDNEEQPQQINFGELLFPSFNTLLLQLIEMTPSLDAQMLKVTG